MTDFDHFPGVDLTLWVRLVLALLVLAGAGTAVVMRLV
jgi:hypothetical protein